MPKRFTATEKWQDSWFRKLPPRLKCLWQYLCDNCDHAGVIEPDWELAGFQIGEEVTAQDVPSLGDRVVQLKCGKLWISKFVEFQYGELSHDCKAHNPVFKALERHRVSIDYAKGIHTLKEEEKETEQEAEGELLKGETVVPPTPDRVGRLNALFARRPTTKWSPREVSAYRSGAELCPIDEFETVEAYYKSGAQFLRKDLQTLLNNWNGELDRARKWRTNPNGTHQHNNKQGVDRNAGTANAGKSSQYAGIGKV